MSMRMRKGQARSTIALCRDTGNRRLEKSKRIFSSCAAATKWENKRLRKAAGALRDEEEAQDARIMAITVTHSTWVWCLPMYQALVVITTFLSERTRSREQRRGRRRSIPCGAIAESAKHSSSALAHTLPVRSQSYIDELIVKRCSLFPAKGNAFFLIAMRCSNWSVCHMLRK